MKKTILFLALVLISLSVNSQTYDNHPFCPPGAVWAHKLATPWDEFYRVSSYVNDTVIMGYPCKKIVQKFIVLYLPTPGQPDTIRAEHIQYRRNLFWRESNDSVYIFHENQFKMLYDFNPTIGDEIIMNRRNNIQPVCDTIQYPELLWDDTLKTVAIDPNFNLNNVLYKHISFNSIERWAYGSVIANIGSTSSLTPCQGLFTYPIVDNMPIDQNCMQLEECGSLYGYYDPLRGYVGNMNSQMESTFNLVVSVSEPVLEKHKQLILYPNPTDNSFSVFGLDENELYDYSIIDLFGRTIEQKNNNNLQNIEISKLYSGSYFIKIVHENFSQTIKFQKK